MNFDLNKIIRPTIKELKPYSSARDEFTGKAEVYLDANENPFETGLNRYPDPFQKNLKNKISKIKNIAQDSIFLGNGSDEVIDLIFRAFCEPGKDEVIVLPPTYGMYQVSADINNIKTKKVSLTKDFEIDESNVFKHINKNTKIRRRMVKSDLHLDDAVGEPGAERRGALHHTHDGGLLRGRRADREP